MWSWPWQASFERSLNIVGVIDVDHHWGGDTPEELLEYFRDRLHHIFRPETPDPTEMRFLAVDLAFITYTVKIAPPTDDIQDAVIAKDLVMAISQERQRVVWEDPRGADRCQRYLKLWGKMFSEKVAQDLCSVQPMQGLVGTITQIKPRMGP